MLCYAALVEVPLELRPKSHNRALRVPLLPWRCVQTRQERGYAWHQGISDRFSFSSHLSLLRRQTSSSRKLSRQASPLPCALGTIGHGQAGALFLRGRLSVPSGVRYLTSRVLAVSAIHDPTAARPGKNLGLSRSSSRRLARSSCVCDASLRVFMSLSLSASLVLLLGERRCCAGGAWKKKCGENENLIYLKTANPGEQGSWTEKFCDPIRRYFRSYTASHRPVGHTYTQFV